MPQQYSLPNGDQRVTCKGHRRDGYYLAADGPKCRVCHLSADLHESVDETVSRLASSDS